ncbi:hypothetical protein FACS1894105_09050 [Clostridia bacterium]|nr:hypothetical protein FACS1894105_09050 [Clostridia bacterium]GHV12379.1 hypothetical protein FACS1894219_05140 [Clostridia bacterium]
MRISYSGQAETFLAKIPEEQRLRIKYAIKHLPDGDVCRLNGYDEAYRLRVGGVRVIFCRFGYKLDIIKIDNRGDVY